MARPLSGVETQAVVDKALAWVAANSKSIKKQLDRDKVAILAKQEYDASEYIAKIAAADKARGILRAVSRAIRDGSISNKWDNGGIDGLSAEGLTAFSPVSMFQTNLRAALAAGTVQYAMETEEVVYMEYVTMRDNRVRFSHAILDKVCLKKDDDFWATHTPPNGTNCRCKVRTYTEESLKEAVDSGSIFQREAPKEQRVTSVNKATGEKVTLPASIQPGYQYNPATEDGAEFFKAMLQRRIDVLLSAPEDTL